MRTGWIVIVLAACSADPSPSGADARGIGAPSPDAAAPTPDAAPPVPDAAPVLPPPVAPGDFSHALDKPYVRSFQTWIDDATFDTKWSSKMASEEAMLGGADSAYHADLASRARALPGGEVLCHGDAKLDNFGWTLVDGAGVLSDNDFDDAGACPAAADILHFVLATDR